MKIKIIVRTLKKITARRDNLQNGRSLCQVYKLQSLKSKMHQELRNLITCDQKLNHPIKDWSNELEKQFPKDEKDEVETCNKCMNANMLMHTFSPGIWSTSR